MNNDNWVNWPEWNPREHHSDPTTNAILNVAESIEHLAIATNQLIYGLKFAKGEGMSIAEAIEVGADKAGDAIAGPLADLVQAVESLDLRPAVSQPAKPRKRKS